MSAKPLMSLNLFENVSFLTKDVKRLLHGHYVVIIGDSVMRCVYKDLILLLHEDRMLDFGELRRRGEREFLGDELVEGGELDELTNGKTYREVRQFQSATHLVRFYFVTRCLNSYVETIFADLQLDPKPSIVIMNSCLWDITRYGPKGMGYYRDNIESMFDMWQRSLGPDTLFIWTTTLPVSENITGGVMPAKIAFMSQVLRLDVMKANFFTSQVARAHGFDVLDLHYVFRRQINHRLPDGIHWDANAHRQMTNLILKHICDAWQVILPQHVSPSAGTMRLDEPNRLTSRYDVIASHRPQSSVHLSKMVGGHFRSRSRGTPGKFGYRSRKFGYQQRHVSHRLADRV